jgi:hypothetical protein
VTHRSPPRVPDDGSGDAGLRINIGNKNARALVCQFHPAALRPGSPRKRQEAVYIVSGLAVRTGVHREASRKNRLDASANFLVLLVWSDGAGTMRRALLREPREPSTRTREGLSLARSLRRDQPHTQGGKGGAMPDSRMLARR